MTILQKVSIF